MWGKTDFLSDVRFTHTTHTHIQLIRSDTNIKESQEEERAEIEKT